MSHHEQRSLPVPQKRNGEIDGAIQQRTAGPDMVEQRRGTADGDARKSGKAEAPSGARAEPRPPCLAHDRRAAWPAIPDHELIRRIGRGSYGEVWLARNVMGEYRAVKIVHRESFDNDRPYEREFNGIRQFEPISRSHASQVNILHVGKGEGCFYYVMELADSGSAEVEEVGEGLAESQSPAGESSCTGAINPETYCPRTLKLELFRRGRLPVDECLEIGLALTTALDHLHQHGLVHRDVKPSNVVFINGIPKLADIGLVTGIDVTHSFVGTEGFIPPEGPGTPEADIYGLGKLLYELSSGKDRRDFPEPPTLLAEFADREHLLELDEIIQKACASPPAARYRCAADMHQDLLVLKAGKSLRRTRQLERRLALMTRAALATLAVMVLGVVPYFLAIREAAHARSEAARALKAEDDVIKKLRLAYLAEARARRSSGRAGQRFASLRAVKGAAAINPDLAARNEAINSLAVSDLRPIPNATSQVPPGAPEVCFDDDLERYAVADQTGTVAVYSLAEHRRLAALTAPGLEPSSIYGFSPDHRFLAVDYLDKRQLHTVKVWNLEGQRALPENLPGNIGLAFSRDSKLLALSADDAIRLYSLPSGAPAGQIPTVHGFDHLVFAPDGTRLACIRFKRSSVYIYELNPGRTNLFIQCPATVVCLAWSPDGKLLATGCTDKRAYVWDPKDANPQAVLEGHNGKIADLAFHPTADILATSGEDDSIRLWDLQSRRQIAIHPGGGLQLQFSPDGRKLGCFKGPSSAGILEVSLSQEYRRLVAPFSGPGVAGPAFSSDGRIIVAGTGELVRFWDRFSGKQIGSFLPVGECDTVLFHPDGQRLITAERNGVFSRRLQPTEAASAAAYRLERPQCVLDGQNLRDAALSLDGRHLGVVDHQTGNLIVLDLEKGSSTVLRGQHPQADYVALSPEGRWAATGSWKNSIVMIWDLEAGSSIKTLTMPARSRVVFSPDGRWLGTSSTEYQLWRVGSWEPEGASMPGYPEPDFNFMAFSPDNKIMAIVDSARNIRLLETSTGKEIASLEAPDAAPIFSLCFSPDGSQLAALEWGQQLQLWDLRLIRRDLRPMGLDWDFAPYPEPPPASRQSVRLEADTGPFSLEELARSIPARDPATPPNLIDLTPYYNLSLTATWHYGDGPSGLSELPRGLQTLAYVPFDVRGLIRVDGGPATGEAYPAEVTGIRVGRACASLHFLYGACLAHNGSAGTRAGSCLIHYANGDTSQWPILVRETLEESLAGPTDSSWAPAWPAIPVAGKPDERIYLFKSTWNNPRPDEPILSIDWISNPSGPAPSLVAITAQ